MHTMAELWQAFSLTHVTYPTSSPLAPLLALLSLLPPFGVCALATAATVYRDVVAAYLLAGSVASAVVTSILKQIIQQPRPPRYDDAEGEVEFGMPSNHACFAWFCAAFVVLYIRRGGAAWAATTLPSRALALHPNAPADVYTCSESMEARYNFLARAWHHLNNGIAACISLLLAAGCAYSRVYLGYHTAAQVYAGSLTGALMGAMWYRLFETYAVGGALVLADGMMHSLERERMAVFFETSSDEGDAGEKED